MANKRMFSKAILQSTKYLKMPHRAQSLYIQLCIDADDEGLVEAFKIMSMIRCSDDDLKILLDKQFIYILNADLLVFIVDWENHNTIRSDRKCLSIYHEELQKYLTNPIGCQMSGRCQADVSHLPDKCPHSIEEYSREEESIEEGKCQADDIQEHASAKASPTVSKTSSIVNNLINYWEDKTRNKVTEVTKKQIVPLITKVLKDYDADDCQDVIDYIINSEYHITNGYTGLLHIFRTTKFAEKLERARLQQPNREPDKSTNLKAWLKWKYKDNDEDKKWWWWENLRGDPVSLQVRFFETKYEEACDYLGIDYMNRVNEAHANGYKYLMN